jgi:hypothetical protein
VVHNRTTDNTPVSVQIDSPVEIRSVSTMKVDFDRRGDGQLGEPLKVEVINQPSPITQSLWQISTEDFQEFWISLMSIILLIIVAYLLGLYINRRSDGPEASKKDFVLASITASYPKYLSAGDKGDVDLTVAIKSTSTISHVVLTLVPTGTLKLTSDLFGGNIADFGTMRSGEVKTKRITVIPNEIGPGGMITLDLKLFLDKQQLSESEFIKINSLACFRNPLQGCIRNIKTSYMLAINQIPVLLSLLLTTITGAIIPEIVRNITKSPSE